MTKKGRTALATALLLVGLGVAIYPSFSDWFNRVNGSVAIQEMSVQLHQTEAEWIEVQRNRAEEYNRKVKSDSEAGTDYEKILDFGDGIMGYIRIPAIAVELPIYHGVDQQVLAKGVGHLPGSAFPIGGEGNHGVLSAHTGFPGAKLFTDLRELEIGDRFYVGILQEELCYRVDQIVITLPQEGEYLQPVPGADYCTLLTCTPYGINSHRLLVRGIRDEKEADTPKEEGVQGRRWWFWCLVPAAVMVVTVGKALKNRRRNHEKIAADPGTADGWGDPGPGGPGGHPDGGSGGLRNDAHRGETDAL